MHTYDTDNRQTGTSVDSLYNRKTKTRHKEVEEATNRPVRGRKTKHMPSGMSLLHANSQHLTTNVGTYPYLVPYLAGPLPCQDHMSLLHLSFLFLFCVLFVLPGVLIPRDPPNPKLFKCDVISPGSKVSNPVRAGL